jgi:hypothetical protein
MFIIIVKWKRSLGFSDTDTFTISNHTYD